MSTGTGVAIAGLWISVAIMTTISIWLGLAASIPALLFSVVLVLA